MKALLRAVGALCAAFGLALSASAGDVAWLGTSGLVDVSSISLNSPGYVKVVANAGPLAGAWSLKGITAWNGTEQTAFACMSNRLYQTAMNGGGAMPSGRYVHQLSVFNQWDGMRTRSYRVQIAQPVGGSDIYARVVAVTVSQEGVNLADCPDPREYKDDTTKIAASYTDAADLAAFPVTKLRLKYQTGYVESEGDAFISLGHCAGPNTRIEVDLRIAADEFAFTERPFGSNGNHTDNPLFDCYISYSDATTKEPKFSWEYTAADGSRAAMNCDPVDQERHAISFDATTSTYTSAKVGTTPYSYTFSKQPANMTSTIPMSVFGRGLSSSPSKAADFGGATKMKVYGVNIYESGTLVKCFVPCVLSGIPGLRDVLSGKFVTGVDDMKVKYGGDIMTIEEPYILLDNANNNGTAGATRFFRTGYPVGPNTTIEFDYAMTGTVSSGFFFSAYSGNNGSMEFWLLSGRTYAFTLNGTQYYNTAAGDVYSVSVANSVGRKRTLAMTANSVALLTAGFTNAVVRKDSALASTLTDMLIGGRRQNGGETTFLPFRLYGVRYYENGKIERNFVPTVTNGVPCLRDTILGSVLYPMTKSGNSDTQSLVAKAGGEFSCTDGSDEAYLEFPGTGSGLDTGYRVTPNSRIEADFSLYDTYKLAGGAANRYELLNQDSGTYVFLAAAVSTYRSLWWQYCDYPTSGSPVNSDSQLTVSNDRRQYIFDAKTGDVVFKCGDDVLFSTTMTGTRTRTDGQANNLKIGRKNAYMRLYGLKIYEYAGDVKTPVRDYVPCVTNGTAGLYEIYTKTFIPLSGGTVSGRAAAGTDAFVTAPQSAKLSHGNSSVTLTCFAPGAQHYQWYEDGVPVEGATSDSLTLNWEKSKAKAGKNAWMYSVKPIYAVFGEDVSGTAVSAMVEYMPLGMLIIIR